MANSFGAKTTLTVGDRQYTMYSLSAVEKQFPQAAKLPFSLKILLENLLRTENGLSVRAADIEAIAKWDPKAEPDQEIAFTPSRVLMQDFTGVPAVVDLAAMRDAMQRMGGDPTKINPLQPAELVIDHSVQVDEFGTPSAFENNASLEFSRNQERYQFLRWGQKAFRNFKVVPPDTGIVHQVNLEYLARVVFVDEQSTAYPDTLVGTDSHTTMINGLGVLGWGVGGIEAEAAMLGQPVSMLLPQVVGFKLFGKLKEGATATDLVLTVTQMLRKKGVVGKFVEFYGDGLAELPLADRATIANMAPEYGATCGIFPVDAETLRYLRTTNRPESLIALVEAYYKAQGMFFAPGAAEASYSDTLELDLSTVVPSLAGPSRPQDRVRLDDVAKSFVDALPNLMAKSKSTALPVTDPNAANPPAPQSTGDLKNGSVVIAAITSCTNTSNPYVMMAAGLLARNAVAKGLNVKPWVKTSLAPGSKVVTEYLKAAGVLGDLETLKFHVVGYGCTTCIGNSGPLSASISKEIEAGKLVVASVLSGNRNFEGRVHPEVRANYLASPPLVVAYALAGKIDIDFNQEPIGTGKDGSPVYLKDIWPTFADISNAVDTSVVRSQYESIYEDVFKGDSAWQSLVVPEGNLYAWDDDSTYVKNPPYFDGMTLEPAPVTDITSARALAVLGDSITTDHISPAGNIKASAPAGQYLLAKGVSKEDFNSYGARRGNHEVMMRGTFANVRLKNLLAPGTEGGVTRHLPDGTEMSIYDASMKYQADHVPLIILAGKEYGSGSSRDWAAKGTRLLGVRAVIAESYERIHRSNLVGMGVLPLQYKPGQSTSTLNLTGTEVFTIEGLAAGIANGFADGRELAIKAKKEDGTEVVFHAIVRIDTPQEVLYYQHGGILPYVLRQLLKS
ncbi:aconitate hydratase AcnA [Tuwongella immobilis]|uniref:Aconitate hydratase n=1 Tax=Tuwongella immobilis TaxID=692036 RepID=A0A6C2YMI7_9BACT|nr:aconitate hydratase AcnA [Tuwongella immobilis]VIP02429.1 aconitate hydratase : Aconitate hydratase OS=Singulisphaera acidiphila (strain ATCC BAA-1392 / DSM 18658 / VKM B-2454 / MOB10) GN=Sinac_6551 PE=3 SV=1: Aconitase: Aconitase_C [Tuwongella immobilis]VTS01371.1 aconitate hydratase : Aconitate hydratase OS=Singulisphaera acidiphila (strain ATCC BAA-1392 / DSM 18658 / VKM B-2454 / MOB10) GN=Sinac_6551 PE=3 SV=1: Aconitase: Aconitase_C [Tuwongella immobilis]